MTIIVFLLILGLLVLVHEFGHYIVAKKNGVGVEEFGIGFPPKLWSKKIGETVYSINLIPLGGFVKLLGEEYSELENKKTLHIKKTFVYQKPHIKALIITGGVLMNLFLGITIYYILLFGNGFSSEPIPLLNPYRFRFGTQTGKVVVTSVAENSPASNASIRQEDLITKYQITPEYSEIKWKPLNSAEALIKVIKNAENTPIYLFTENMKDGTQKVARVIPQYNPKLKRAVIGIGLLDMAVITYTTPTQKVFSGFLHSYNIMTYNFKTVASLFKTAVKEKNAEVVSGVVSGPIGIFTVIADIVHTSGKKLFTNILNISALLSLSLAFMNILPFPALDGGRFMFVLYEWVTKRPINKTLERYANLGGFMLLILLALIVSANDIMRFFK